MVSVVVMGDPQHECACASPAVPWDVLRERTAAMAEICFQRQTSREKFKQGVLDSVQRRTDAVADCAEGACGRGHTTNEGMCGTPENSRGLEPNWDAFVH